jgi:hypothetical protein
MIYGSPRQAIAYLVTCRQGPGMARPSHNGLIAKDTGRHHLDHVLVGALLYGPREQGYCGVVKGSGLDLELQQWATQRGLGRSDEVRAVERRMRCLLRAHGIMVARYRFHARRHVSDDGSPVLRAVGFEALDDSDLHAWPSSAQTSPISDTCA